MFAYLSILIDVYTVPTHYFKLTPEFDYDENLEGKYLRINPFHAADLCRCSLKALENHWLKPHRERGWKELGV